MKHRVFRFCLLSTFFLSSCKSFEGPNQVTSLPQTARIIIKESGYDKRDATAKACADFALNENEVRKIFNSYQKIEASELHDKYLWAPCYVQGTLELQDKTFFWRARPGNTLETNYPDGKNIILGGKPTDDPSEK